MKGRNLWILFTGISSVFSWNLFGLKHDPWIRPLFEMEAGVRYGYSYFPNVANGINPISYSSYVNEVQFEYGASVTPSLFIQTEIEFDETKKLDFNLLSVAPYVGYQMMNDLTGDVVALLIGGYFRYVPYERLSDVATPYSGEFNFNIFFSIGKEFDRNELPAAKVYAMLDGGIATRGAPFLNVDVQGEVYFYQRNKIKMGVEGFYGFGKYDFIDIGNFSGYGEINHRSLDIKIGYQYDFFVWGSASILYKRRVLALCYPEDLDAVEIKYNVGFSF